MSASVNVLDLPQELAPQAAPGTWECVLAQLPRGGSVFVAGAGRGGLSILLHRNGFEVTSLDLHPEHFAVPGLTCERADFNEPLALRSDAYDAVVAVEVVEHLENPWGFLREAVRVLKPDGKLVFTSPNVAGLHARMLFLRSGTLPYFREESFVGCYHVSPIFPWAVERWTRTTTARLASVTYSRANWPTRDDVPRHWERRWSRVMKRLLPVNAMTGEISCYTVVKDGVPTVPVGTHSG